MKRFLLAHILVLFMACPSFAGMKVAFWVGDGSDFYESIKRSLRFEYAHIELVFSNGTFWSSVPEEGARFSEGIPAPYRWYFFDLDVSPEVETEIFQWAITHEGEPYDIYAIQMGLKDEDPNALFCCEAVLVPLEEFGVINLEQEPYQTDVKEAFRYFWYQ